MAQAKVGEVLCFDVVGFIPRKQRRMTAQYHPDGVELDASEPMGGPFSVIVRFLTTEEEYELATELLARYAGGDPVTIVKSDGKTYENCFIGRKNPASAVVEQKKGFGRSANQAVVEGEVVVSGHVVFAE